MTESKTIYWTPGDLPDDDGDIGNVLDAELTAGWVFTEMFQMPQPKEQYRILLLR